MRVLRQRAKVLVCAAIVAFSLATLMGVAQGEPADDALGRSTGQVPAGPEVDFCPSAEQIQEHLRTHGFDYKPTVPCTADGRAVRPAPDPEDAAYSDEQLSKQERQARRKGMLQSARRLPDSDGDPATLEGVLPDGRKFVIFVSTNDPERYKDMAFDQFAREMYP